MPNKPKPASKSAKSAKSAAPDRLLPLSIAAVVVTLVVGFTAVWFYWQYAQKRSAETRYLTLPAIAISRDGHSIRAGLAVRTTGNDADWAAGNKRALEQIMARTLMEADPVRVRSADGIAELQHAFRQAGNAALHTDKLREVLITDLLVSEGDL